MRIRLDPWNEEAPQAQLGLKPFAGDVTVDLELKQWKPIPSKAIPEYLHQVHVVDGSRRLEARVILEEDGANHHGAFGAYAVGHALLELNSKKASISQIESGRVLAVCGNLTVPDIALAPPKGGSGKLVYPLLCDARLRNEPQSAVLIVQRLMLQREQSIASKLALGLEDVMGGLFELDTLVLQDGPVDIKASDRLILGYIKSFETDYLGPLQRPTLHQLKVNERTPIFYFQYGGEERGRFSWYVRLSEMSALYPQGSGVVRLEMAAPEELNGLPKLIKRIADFSPHLLGMLGSMAHKDPRAPQNLIPTGALERELKRRMGDAQLISRRIRGWIMEQSWLG